ncbi:MAG TPA: DEAD/DEAH box helicase [Bacteroidota bacterium]|nr:DEAD/DEAH box helicase [Bacteroidota bacterium]
MINEDALAAFHPVVRTWFPRTFGEASAPQKLGWPSIAAGKNTLIVAPTGSGKTLAAFLWCINHLVEESIEEHGAEENDPSLRPDKKKNRTLRDGADKKNTGIRVLYISPLKALNNDIHRNLELPLKGIHEEAIARGLHFPKLRSAVRTGDTTQAERAAILKNPPDILITTPESLYLMLSSQRARHLFSTLQYVIVDEIHSVSGNKRGVHLSLSLERLERVAASSFVRIGLSATQRPLETIARFLGGQEWRNGTLTPREVTIIDAGYKKKMDLQVTCVVQDFSELPTDSIWSLIFPQLLDAIYAHNTTLIFVNNRRLAERVAATLNELLQGQEHTFNGYAVPFSPAAIPAPTRAADFLVQAYHGSMSRTAREKMESELKAGKLKVLVATSALELGIDIGSIDLVVQIQSPHGIARGLQRVGRSGHLVSATSKGRMYVTHRQDLLESTVVAREMMDHAIEETHVPQDCLDVLAQQIVSMVSVEEWTVDDLFDVVRQSYCYRSLSKKIFTGVVQMLAGRYTNEAFRELRPRISWDKVHGSLSPLPGSSHLAITNAGTIPDRGYFGVYLEDLKTKIGEVDEEFIYESRSGDTFILGSNVWKMLAIDANRVIVGPAPGQPARMPFWRGEGIGRSFELGEKLGKFMEEVAERDGEKIEWLLENFPIDAHSARNIVEYIGQQKAVTRDLPTHRSIVVEGFRDEIGDPRIVVHSCFGRRVNGLLGLVLSHQLKERLGIEIQMLYNDDGILFRCSDVERLPLDLFSGLTRTKAQELVLEELVFSPLFGSLFRQNAERALLLPKARIGKRTPLWLQRLRAGDLLQIVRTYDDFPIVIETIRDCLYDSLDFDRFKEVMGRIESGEIVVHSVQSEMPSPFAASVLFDFIAVYIYEGDQPKGEISSQQRALNRELLAEIVDLDSVRSVVKPDALLRIEEQLQFTSETRKARTPEELLEIFLRIGELTEMEIEERSATNDLKLKIQLAAQGTIAPVSIKGSTYFIASEEMPIYLTFADVDAATLSSLPEEFRTSPLKREESLRYVIGRMIRSHTPISSARIAERYGLTVEECDAILGSFTEEDAIVRGIFLPDSDRSEWCYRPTLDRIHRASISILRKEIKPATIAHFTKFLLQWQHRDPATREKGETGIQSVLEQFEGFALNAELWESEILLHRISEYDPAQLRAMAARGEIVCAGVSSGKAQWVFQGDGAYFMDEMEKAIAERATSSQELYDFLKANGASFLSDIREGTTFSLSTVNRAISELFWSGLITNDLVDEALNVKRFRTGDDSPLPSERITLLNPRRNPLKSIAMSSVRKAIRSSPGWNGRWSILHTRRVLGEKVSPEERASRQAQQLLLRYGIVAREIAKREENLLPWPLLALELQRMELRGEIRRGYFVEGLSGMQFALPAAIDVLKSINNEQLTMNNEAPIVINACDPSNPYGVGIEAGLTKFPEGVRFARHPLNYFVFFHGSPVLWIESFGARIYTVDETAPDVLRSSLQQFAAHVRASHKNESEIVVEYCNGVRPTESPLAETFRSLGFYRDRAQTIRFELR